MRRFAAFTSGILLALLAVDIGNGDWTLAAIDAAGLAFSACVALARRQA